MAESGLDQAAAIKGAVVGAGAWIVSFVIMLVLVVALEDGDDAIGGAGNFLYGSHFVDSKSELSGASGGGSETLNVIQDGSPELPEVVYFIIPVLVLFAAGVAVVRLAALTDEKEGAIAGALLTVGYLVLTVVGTFVIEANSEQSTPVGTVETTVSPELGAMTIVVMGVLYPAVIGAIGGYAGAQMASGR